MLIVLSMFLIGKMSMFWCNFHWSVFSGILRLNYLQDESSFESISWDIQKLFNGIITIQKNVCTAQFNFNIMEIHEYSVGSETEERDIRKAYEGGKGCLNFMMNSVPFMTVEDEPRIMEKVKGWSASILPFIILSSKS